MVSRSPVLARLMPEWVRILVRSLPRWGKFAMCPLSPALFHSVGSTLEWGRFWFTVAALLGLGGGLLGAIAPGCAQSPPVENLDLAPEIYEASPRLQEWLRAIPDVRQSIRQDSALVTRVRVGYSQFPSTAAQGGWTLGVEDLFVATSPLTLSAHYAATHSPDRETWGADLRYYTLPRGQYVNVAPVFGFRQVRTEGQDTAGATVGVRVNLALSRTGAADLALQQVFVSPGSAAEVGITTVALGYALTPAVRLATEIEKQNSPWEKDSRVSIFVEWLP